jgi:transposase
MQSYSLDLRRRVLSECDRGTPTSAVATMFAVSPAWVRRLKQRLREDNCIEPRKPGGDFRSKIKPEVYESLCQIVLNDPDKTIRQLCEIIKQELRIETSAAALCRTLRKLGLTLKKSR